MGKTRLIVIIFSSFFVTVGLLGTLFYNYFDSPKLGGDFSLVHRDSPWTFKDHSKEVNLLYIGYAKCPDVCPLSLSVAGQAFRALSAEEQERIGVVFVSVDHENDDADHVANYASQFNSKFIGLTGSKQAIDHVVDLFGTSYVVETKTKSAMGYLIGHSDRFYFLDSKGHVLSTISNPRNHKLVVNQLRKLL